MELLRKTAAQRIERQTQGLTPEEVTNISLTDVPLLSERLVCFTALSHLTLVSMKPKLKTLLAVPLDALKSLRMLDVSDNSITLSADESISEHPSLRKLFISNNCIKQWDEMVRLASAFPKLELLDAANNDAYDASRFAEVFDLFPNLLVLDSTSRDGEEVAVADTDEDSSDDDDEEEEEDDDGGDCPFIADEESEVGSAGDAEPPSKVARTE